jgi:hypothetical protein
VEKSSMQNGRERLRWAIAALYVFAKRLLAGVVLMLALLLSFSCCILLRDFGRGENIHSNVEVAMQLSSICLIRQTRLLAY